MTKLVQIDPPRFPILSNTLEIAHFSAQERKPAKTPKGPAG